MYNYWRLKFLFGYFNIERNIVVIIMVTGT